MKKIFWVAAFSLLLLITGCSSSSFLGVGVMENTSNRSWSSSHQYMNGTKSKTFTLDGQQPTLLFEAQTDSGGLEIRVTDKDDAVCYVETDVGNADDTIELPHSGRYKVELQFEKHKGSFNIQFMDGSEQPASSQ